MLAALTVVGFTAVWVGFCVFVLCRPSQPTDYEMIAEGIYDRVDYVSRRYTVLTVVYFQDETTCVLQEDVARCIEFPKGTKIKIMENNINYKIEKVS